jgi:glycosyltransferase involved in cell wall biosynthesis
MNYQSWKGFPDPRYGYGSMLKGFVDHVPADITLHEHADVMVFMMQPFQLRRSYKGQHKTCFTMWETDTLPERFEHWLSTYEQLIVPCTHNLELFSRHHPKVKLVPLGVDTKLWKPVQRPANPRFRFHAAGSQWIRKGLDTVLEAFRLADLDAELHLKPNPEAKDVPNIRDTDNVFIHRTWFNDKQTLNFFHSADCWVAATRGEGFGLMPLQAMACGVPVIMNGASGQGDFAHLAPIVIPHRPVASHYGGTWDESDPKELAEAMRDMYHNHKKHAAHAKTNVSKISEWSWDKAARKLADALPAGSLLPNPTIVKRIINYHVTLDRSLQCEIADRTYRFVENSPLLVPEGVLRVLQASGYVRSYRMEYE